MTQKKLALSVLFLIFVVSIALFFVFSRNTETEISDEIVIDEVYDVVETKRPLLIGTSVEGRSIEAYTYGTGEHHLLVVGGIHGGYEWNSILLAYEMVDYFEINEKTLPENVKITVIPSLNPDGLFKLIQKEGRFTTLDVPDESLLPSGTGRFNANNVDLNRNFNCKWQPKSTWRGQVVLAGTSAFSEPEAQALQRFVTSNNISVGIFLHSQSNAVYASECHNGVLPETLVIMNAYSNASGYRAVEEFGAYPVTGDAEGWLASIGIPAITVELSTHKTIEWDRNIKGIQALITHYATL